MGAIIDILPLGNDHYLWSIGFVILSLAVSLFPTKAYIREKKDYLFFLPLAAFMAGSLHSVRIGIDLGTIFLICAVLYALVKRRAFPPRHYMWFLAAYFLCMAVSLIWSRNVPQGIHILRRCLPLVTFSIGWCMFELTQEQWERILLVFFRASLLFIIFSITTTLYISFSEHFSWWEFFGIQKHPVHGIWESYKWVYSWLPYNHPSYNAYGLVAGMICGQYLLRVKRISIPEAVFYALSLFLLLVLSQSRIGIVMYAITIPIAAVSFIQSPKWRKLYHYGVGAMIVVALIGWVQVNTVFSLDHPREHIYHVTVDFIRQNPVWGVGVGSLAETLQQDEICLREEYGNPHNQILGDWLQGGIPCLLAMLAMMGYLVYYAVRYRNQEMLLFVIITLLFMQIEMPLDIIKGLTTFVAFVHLFAHKPNDRYNSKYASMCARQEKEVA
jgi:O-antigen ligase